MVHLTQNPVTGYFDVLVGRDGNKIGQLANVHTPAQCASAAGCAVHNRPSDHPLKSAPLNWREDRNILERICEHGIGHPDFDSATYLTKIGNGYENVHGCDGCCVHEDSTVQVCDLQGGETLVSPEGGITFVFNVSPSNLIEGCYAVETDFGVLYLDAEKYVTVQSV